MKLKRRKIMLGLLPRGKMRVLRNPWPSRADIVEAQEISTLADAVERFIRAKARSARSKVRHLERVRARNIRARR